jgi:hypothetical protein
LIHYILKLDVKEEFTKEVIKIIGKPTEYNQQSVSSKGCFYIKISAPTTTNKIKRDINGDYIFTGKKLIGPDRSLNYFSLIKNSNISKESIVVKIKAPHLNEIVTGNTAPSGYIIGKSNNSIFSLEKNEVTNYGKQLYDIAVKMLYAS